MCGYIKRKDKPFRMNKVIQNPIQNEEIEKKKLENEIELLNQMILTEQKNIITLQACNGNFLNLKKKKKITIKKKI